MKILCVFCVLSLIFASLALAQTQTQSQAVTQTQELLRDPSQRQKALKGDANAQGADAAVGRLVGGDSKMKSEIYDLSAELFPMLAEKYGGDPKKMQEALEQFSKNPDAFASQFSPEQRAKLHKLAEQLQQRDPSTQSKP